MRTAFFASHGAFQNLLSRSCGSCRVARKFGPTGTMEYVLSDGWDV